MKELNNDIKIVFFDIDDTLYDKNKAYLPDSISQKVIPRLKAKGIIPAIATGRCLGAFPKPVRSLLGKEGIEVLVTINGQYNCYNDTVISQYPLAPYRVEQIVQTLNQPNFDYAFIAHEEVAVPNNSPKIAEALRPIKSDYLIDADYHKNNTIFQMLAFYSQEEDILIKKANVLGNDLKAVRWHKHSVDLLYKDNSKAKGIFDVLKHFQLDIKNAMAFGDGENDLEMLSSVGYGVAMGNAIDSLKEKADFVTLPIHEDGIVHALEKLNVI